MRTINNSHKLALFSGVFHSTRMLIGALQALYLLETGVSLNNLAFLKAYFALLVLIFDVPFGMLGDFISNKICIYFSCIFVALYYFFSLYSPDLTFLIIAESFYAMAIILAFVFFIYSLSNYIANKLAKNKLSINNDSFRTTSLVSFLILTSVLVMIFVPETRLFLLIAVFSCAHGFMTVFSNLTKSVLIAGTEKQQIATVISLSNVLGRLFSTIILFLCSLLINNNMLQYVFILTFISIMIATVIYLKDHPNRILT